VCVYNLEISTMMRSRPEMVCCAQKQLILGWWEDSWKQNRR